MNTSREKRVRELQNKIQTYESEVKKMKKDIETINSENVPTEIRFEGFTVYPKNDGFVIEMDSNFLAQKTILESNELDIPTLDNILTLKNLLYRPLPKFSNEILSEASDEIKNHLKKENIEFNPATDMIDSVCKKLQTASEKGNNNISSMISIANEVANEFQNQHNSNPQIVEDAAKTLRKIYEEKIKDYLVD